MADSRPISAPQFALAIADLPLSTLSLKALEIRNSIAHLDYSNEQLLPFTQTTPPDTDCVDAIKENEIVIARMLERIELLKKEVEGRGVRWEELSGESAKEEEGVEGLGRGGGEERQGQGERERTNPWTDGTFTTGRIINGEVRMDDDSLDRATSGEGSREVNGVGANGTNGVASTNTSATTNGGRLDDEALRRAMEERMRSLGQEDDEGMHL